jgi:hypothetical protein
MHESEMADFFRALGYKTLQTKSCFWYSPERFLFKNLPVHRVVEPSAGERAKVLIRGGALALRYPSPATDPSEADGGMYVCADRNYDFESLTANARSHTRRGLARCTVEQIEFGYLAEHGHPLIDDTTIRQTGTHARTTEADWRKYCNLASANKDIVAWGALAEDRLAAFLVAMRVGECTYIHLQKSAADLLKYYSNNALLFTYLKAELARPEVKWISNGQVALAAREGLSHFKTSMGFKIEPFKEQVVLNPLVKHTAWIGKVLTNRLTRLYPENLFWRRAARALDLAR